MSEIVNMFYFLLQAMASISNIALSVTHEQIASKPLATCVKGNNIRTFGGGSRDSGFSFQREEVLNDICDPPPPNEA